MRKIAWWHGMRGKSSPAVLAGMLLASCQGPAERAEGTPPYRSGTAGAASVSEAAGAPPHASFLYGRVTTYDGAVREGRLRWGGDEEALWSHQFNGVKAVNPWDAYAPREQAVIGAFGKRLISWERDGHIARPFMARFGDIARIDLRGRDLHVTLKSGTRIHVARYGADDMNDGVRLWNESGAYQDISERAIRTIELLPTPILRGVAAPLYGTVRTHAGEFTGLLQWNREAALRSDELTGDGSGRRTVRFDSVQSIERRGTDRTLVALLAGGEEISLRGADATLRRGIYVDDARYGRVLVSPEAVVRVDFRDHGNAPAYDDFPVGRPLMGEVVTRTGRRLSGRLVFDLDESEDTETLDAPSAGVDYMIPFHRILSIVPAHAAGATRAKVRLSNGELLELDERGDLHRLNAGMLIFVDGRDRAERVPWTDVARVELRRSSNLATPGT